VSCKAADTSDIPADIEVSHNAGTTDRILYEYLKQVENDATIIVDAVAKDIIGQNVSTSYDYELKKELPGSGYTKRECEVTKVYKGDVEQGDTVVLLQDYYIWTYSDENSNEKQQLITTSYLKPATKDKSYLLFLKYDDRNDGYWPVCDYEGMFSIPSDDMMAKTEAGTLKQSDLDVYEYEGTLSYLMPIYDEVVTKYFSSDQP
jgi:hypothetical protein